MRKTKLTAILIIIMLTLSACATLKIDTPAKRLYAARKTFNSLLVQYIDLQDQVSQSNQSKAVMAFKSADMALDLWEEHIDDSDYDWKTDVNTWLAAKTIILNIISEVTNGN